MEGCQFLWIVTRICVLLSSVISRYTSFRQYTQVSAYVCRKGYLPSLWKMRITTRCKTSSILSLAITKNPVFILAFFLLFFSLELYLICLMQYPHLPIGTQLLGPTSELFLALIVILISSVVYLWPQLVYWSPNCPLTLFLQPPFQVIFNPSFISLPVSWCPDWIRNYSPSRYRNIFPLLNAILSVSG